MSLQGVGERGFFYFFLFLTRRINCGGDYFGVLASASVGIFGGIFFESCAMARVERPDKVMRFVRRLREGVYIFLVKYGLLNRGLNNIRYET